MNLWPAVKFRTSKSVECLNVSVGFLITEHLSWVGAEGWRKWDSSNRALTTFLLALCGKRSSVASSPFSITSLTSSPTSLIAVILASVFRGCWPVTQLWWPPGQDEMEMDTVDLTWFSEARNPEKKKGLRGTCYATFDLSLTVMALCIKRDGFRQMGSQVCPWPPGVPSWIYLTFLPIPSLDRYFLCFWWHSLPAVTFILGQLLLHTFCVFPSVLIPPTKHLSYWAFRKKAIEPELGAVAQVIRCQKPGAFSSSSATF